MLVDVRTDGRFHNGASRKQKEARGTRLTVGLLDNRGCLLREGVGR